MAKADRQRFNFLTALNRQLEAAMSEGDDEYETFRTFVQSIAQERWIASPPADDRLDAHAQWLAALEARLEDMEQAVELIAGEESDSDDDGLDDEDLGGDEPRMGGDPRDAGRHPANLVRARDGQEPGRALKSSKSKVAVSTGKPDGRARGSR